MAVERRRGGVLEDVKVDLIRLHETWMGLAFPRQRTTDAHSVLGKWTPSTTGGWVVYRLWAVLGALVVAAIYPLALLGLAVRFHTRRIDSTATRLGLAGVVLLAILAWGSLAVVARFRFSVEGFLAVLSAAIVATFSAALAVLFARVGGRGTTIGLAYPAAMTAIFLPPVVAALYSPVLADLIFPGSESIAEWFLDTFLAVGDLNTYLRTRYDLEGVAYVAMWFAIAVPLGWLLGGIVTLADVVRP